MNIISTFISGFVLARPVMQIKSIFEHRGRVLVSVLLGSAAFVLFMTSFVLGTAEIVLQYDAQGFVIWSPLLTLSALYLLFCAIAAISSAAVFPKPEISVAPQFQEIIHKLLQSLANQYPPPGPETSSRRAAEEPNAVAQEMHEVAREREKIRQHPRGDLDLDQTPTPAFTH